MSIWRGAAAMCVNENKELLMILQGRKNEEKRWSVPSGEAEGEETYEACCAREVWEETGYEAKVGRYLHEKGGISRGILYKVKYFEIELIGGAPAIHDPDELIYDIQWKSAREIEQLELTYPEDRAFLLEYVRTGFSRIVYRSNPLAVRELLPSDADLLHRWLSDPAVLEYYEGRDRPQTREKVQAHFYGEDKEVSRCIVEYDGRPIGYIQYYRLDEAGTREYELEDTAAGERIFGMDQFIGEPAYWNRGIGRHLVSSMLRHLEEQHRAERVVMDPQTWNGRAVACYEKSGFRKVKLLPGHEWHEGRMRDCWLMEWRRLEGPYAEV